MKSLFNEYWAATDDGRALGDDARIALAPLFHKYIGMGYNAREIENIITSEARGIEAEKSLRHAVELRRQRLPCPQHGSLNMVNGVCHGTHILPVGFKP